MCGLKIALAIYYHVSVWSENVIYKWQVILTLILPNSRTGETRLGRAL